MATKLTEMTKDELIILAKEVCLEIDPAAKKAVILAEIQAGIEPTPEPGVEKAAEVPKPKPTIKPSKHAAMCGQATVDNHEERIRDLEAAVEYLLAL